MEITSTTVNRTARHITEKAILSADYTTTNGQLERIQVNIYESATETDSQAYLGTVYYDGRNVSCHIPWHEDAVYYFQAAAGFIASIIESAPTADQQQIDNETNHEKSR